MQGQLSGAQASGTMQEGHLMGRAAVQGGEPTGTSHLVRASSWALGAAVGGSGIPCPAHLCVCSCDQLLWVQLWTWHIGTKELGSLLSGLWAKAGLSFVRDALGRWSCSPQPFLRSWCCWTVWLIAELSPSLLSCLPVCILQLHQWSLLRLLWEMPPLPDSGPHTSWGLSPKAALFQLWPRSLPGAFPWWSLGLSAEHLPTRAPGDREEG